VQHGNTIVINPAWEEIGKIRGLYLGSNSPFECGTELAQNEIRKRTVEDGL
jgi:hypothetical protein